MKGRFCFVGFDSAWTDKAIQPGAIAAAVFENGQCVLEYEPQLARFSDALSFIKKVSQDADYTLIALDQPTVVPNQTGGRPAERVARSVISGVQPARREVVSMFGDSAPIWTFLKALGARQNPPASRVADRGTFLMEVFPALSIPSLEAMFWKRKKPAKYNPGNPKFDLSDWRILTQSLAGHADRLGLQQVSAWLQEQHENSAPTKSDQDRLDGALCLILAVEWRAGPLSSMLCIGDALTGYIVTHATGATRDVILRSAGLRGVPVDDSWPADVAYDGFESMPLTPSKPRTSKAAPFSAPAQIPAIKASQPEKVVFEPKALRNLLIQCARNSRTITYGEVARHFGFKWSQGAGSALNPVLNGLGDENMRRNEPLLMVLVVGKSSGLPGPGFFPRDQYACSQSTRGI
ncbi:MAG: DUF429 domain-containing protein [Micropepsaceae bacterium]